MISHEIATLPIFHIPTPKVTSLVEVVEKRLQVFWLVKVSGFLLTQDLLLNRPLNMFWLNHWLILKRSNTENRNKLKHLQVVDRKADKMILSASLGKQFYTITGPCASICRFLSQWRAKWREKAFSASPCWWLV